MNTQKFKIGDIVQHFKRSLLSKEMLIKNPMQYLYEIIGYGKDSDTMEDVVIYKALYNEKTLYVRRKDEFESLVDKRKYPYVKQLFRFENLEFTEHKGGYIL